MKRRDFLKRVGAAGLALTGAGLARPLHALANSPHNIAAAFYTGPKTILRGDDGGYYYCTNDIVVGGSNYVVWFGASPKGTWGNVFVGRPVWNGQVLDYITGKWWDTPYGTTTGSGTLELRESRGNFYRRSETGGFGGTTWTKVNREKHQKLPVAVPTQSRRGEGLTGIWTTETGAMYYIRQLGSDVIWFAARPPDGPGNVFWGSRSGSSVSGRWMDIPWGQTEIAGFLSLEVFDDDNLMVQRPVNEAYASTRFIRIS